MPIRILIADDHGIIRSGIRNELATHPDIEVMGDAGDGDEALKMTLELRPDILLLDINMPGLKSTSSSLPARKSQTDDPCHCFHCQ